MRIPFIHYSDKAGLTYLDPTMRGTSGRGEESARRANGEVLTPASYVYPPVHTPEAKVSSCMYLYAGSFNGKMQKKYLDPNGFTLHVPTRVIEITDAPHTVWHQTEMTQGCTFNLFTGLVQRKVGYVVSYKDSGEVFQGLPEQSDVKNFICSHIRMLLFRKNNVGSWFDKGQTYLDISTIIIDRNQAIQFAHRNEQLGIYDLKADATIVTGAFRDSNRQYLAIFPDEKGFSHDGMKTPHESFEYQGITGTGI
jgi:hypothetical protein